MTLKQQIHQHLQLLQDKIDVFRDMILIDQDAKNNAKGSAGDKHETALSMMHIEQEKLNHKLKEILTKSNSRQNRCIATHNKIALGSVVKKAKRHVSFIRCSFA
jgi:urease accessory protein UreH